MPSSTVGRRRDAEGHLAAAAEYIKIAESGDAERSAYEHAALEIEAAMEDDPGLTHAVISKQLGKSRDFVGRLLRSLARARAEGTQFSVDWGRGSHSTKKEEQQVLNRLAREQPKEFVRLFEQAPPAARKAIAKEIAKAPEVRIEARLRDQDEPVRRPSPVKKGTQQTLYQFESHLVSARRNLREALALVAEMTQPGDDEDIIDLLSMLKGLVEANAEAYRSGKSLDDWAWELYERSSDA